MAVKAELTGVPQLVAQLRALQGLEDGKAIRAAVKFAIRPAVVKARETIPVGTQPHKTYKGRIVAPGFARRSIKVATFISKDKQSATAVIGVKAEAYYATQFLELGTSKMAARPWLRPAMTATADEQLKRLSTGLSRAIARLAKKRGGS